MFKVQTFLVAELLGPAKVILSYMASYGRLRSTQKGWKASNSAANLLPIPNKLNSQVIPNNVGARPH